MARSAHRRRPRVGRVEPRARGRRPCARPAVRGGHAARRRLAPAGAAADLRVWRRRLRVDGALVRVRPGEIRTRNRISPSGI